MNAYLGAGLKYTVKITVPGFSMADDNWKLVLQQNKKTLELQKSDCFMDSDGIWYFCFDSSEFSNGKLYIITYAYVPDGMFPNGIRTEIDKTQLVEILKV